MGKKIMLRTYREAFNQHLTRYGVPLPKPSNDIKVGDLVVFKNDGTCIKLLSIYDEKGGYVREANEIEPIVTNGMRCRRLKLEEREL
jgi:hypothetical protein